MTTIMIQGTNGSGKSTLVRRVMDAYPDRDELRLPGRKRPVGYQLYHPRVGTLFVPGHYETPCGGCDTLGSPRDAFDDVHEARERGEDVLFEGIMAQDSTAATVALAGDEFTVIALATPLEECLEAIRGRRRERGNPRPLDPSNTRDRQRSLERRWAKLAAAGVRVEHLGRAAALLRARALLRLDYGA